MHSFLLIGQSNMAGRGRICEAKAIDTRRIFVFRDGIFQPFSRPVSRDFPDAGVCLAESFAESYVKKYGVDVGIIPCAVGGTRIEQWKKGSELFENAVNQVELARKNSEIAGILWHQGESDTAPERCEVYEENLDNLVNDLRTSAHLENVPFITGALGDFLEFYEPDPRQKNYPLINTATKNVVKKNDKMGYVSADGLTANKDNLHFNAEALYEFGLRYFEEYERVKSTI